MSLIALVFGILMTLLGGILYFPEMASITALIPSFFGIALIVLGLMARSDKLRMHAMHVAALLGLVGFAMPTFMGTRSLLNGNAFEWKRTGGQFAMAGLCLLFLALCIKSFIDARIARKQKAAEELNK